MSRRFIDSADRALFLRLAVYLGGVGVVFASVIGFALFHQQRIGEAGFIGVVLLGSLIGILLSALVWGGTGLASRAIVQVITGAGNLKPARSYSLEESLIARGHYKDAEEAFLAHLAREPDDHAARLALAALYRDHLDDPAHAEALFLEVRRSNPTSGQEFAIGNALIDLYRTTGQPGREIAELARFAERYRGSQAGARAAEALRRLKERG